MGASASPLRPPRPFYFPIDSGFTPAKKCQFDAPTRTVLSRLVLPVEVQQGGTRLRETLEGSLAEKHTKTLGTVKLCY